MKLSQFFTEQLHKIYYKKSELPKISFKTAKDDGRKPGSRNILIFSS